MVEIIKKKRKKKGTSPITEKERNIKIVTIKSIRFGRIGKDPNDFSYLSLTLFKLEEKES